MKELRTTPWTSFRSYLTHDGQARSLVFNEKTHHSFFLDGETSLIWSEIENGVDWKKLIELARSLKVEDELDQFIEGLKEDGLVEFECATGGGVDRLSHPDPAPAPKAFEFSQATEPLNEFMTWIADHGFLYSVHWEITWRCNERCIHCYNPGAAHLPHEKPERDTNELTTEEVFKVLEELRSIGVFRITLSGGEPMLRRDFWEILSRMREMGFQVGIYTNGLKLLAENANRLASLYPNSVSISIYSDEAQAHDKITRESG